MPKFNLNGRILGEDIPSPIDGKPCVAISTGHKQASLNPKTGNMIQTFFIRSDIDPWTAFKNGEGYSVCGDCPHAKYNDPKANGFAPCYVTVFRSVLSVYRAYKRGSYKHIGNDWGIFDDVSLRLGSFGDPCVLPVEILNKILPRVRNHTGYTHQWKNPVGQHLKGICQASCDGMTDYIEATSHGWMPFLVRREGEQAPKGAMVCPASKEGGKRTNCSKCSSCDGSSRPVVIINH